MEHAIEHAVGVYIALVGIACLVGILTKWLAHLPYTIALTLVGLALAIFKVGPSVEETGFSRDLVFFVLLPPLLFQGALHMQLWRLRRHAIPVGVFATVGVILTTVIIGGITAGLGAFQTTMIAMLFGALICTTDPVSVLAIFRRSRAPADLKYLVEGESLFNDGTGVVVFTILLEMVLHGEAFDAGAAALEFLRVSLGGALVGLLLGGVAFSVLRRLNDHLLENMICLLLCYGVFWTAEHWHLSGVIAVVTSGLLIGNHGREMAMNPRTTETVETFFESIDFLINSLLFILIGLELRAIPLPQIASHLPAIGIAIGAVLAGRAAVVYPLFFAMRRIGGERPASWSHVLFWGGLRGSIPIALLLGLPHTEALGSHRIDLLVVGFGVICFSLIVQGLTMKPLLLALRISDEGEEESDPGHHTPSEVDAL
ncbi:sodium:proton antiporter [Candidatus Sumerlaeota bacterium]|nr:sodium:proton antiporter [Candidatus Sumerlaeota bacterium]